MLITSAAQKRSRDEYSEEAESGRQRHRGPQSGRVSDIECKAYAPGTGIFDIRLSNVFKYNWAYVALFFYSHDFTPQAIADLSVIQNYTQQMKDKRIMPMAISTDTVLVHEAFVQRIPGHRIDFPILSDTIRLISSHLQILDANSGCSKRAMFLINEDLDILHSVCLADQNPYPIETLCAKVHTL